MPHASKLCILESRKLSFYANTVLRDCFLLNKSSACSAKVLNNRRTFTSTPSRMATPSFSQGADKKKLQEDVDKLTSTERPWQLISSGQGLERSFRFKTFKAAWVRYLRGVLFNNTAVLMQYPGFHGFHGVSLQD